MGAGHGHKLHFHGHSAIHRIPAHLKILTLLAFMITVVATPRDWYLAYVGYLLASSSWSASRGFRRRTCSSARWSSSRSSSSRCCCRSWLTGPQTEVLGVSVSQHGLEAGIALLIKGTLGVLASLTLAATTEPQDLLLGLERLRLPQQLVQIMSFMVRYLDVVTGEMQRMKVARESRGFTARNPKHWPVLARSAGALFIRSYERGERVHLAMLSRGYTGRMPK